MKSSHEVTRSISRAMSVALVVALVASLVSLAPAAAQNNDLVMFTLDANPKPLKRGCSATLSASFLINGHQDDLLSSGDAEIRFYWADGASSVPTTDAGWSLIGPLSVTWTAADGPFAIGREWPTGFPSVAGSGKSWSVPSSGSTFHIRAVADYTAASGVTDQVPGNNEAIVPNVPSVEGNCGGGSCCTPAGNGLMICNLACIDPGVLIPVEWLRCLVRPELCRPPRVPLCQLIDCNPCLRGLSCPPFPWELLVRWPPEVMEVELFARGEMIARSEPLRRPITHNGEKFHQVIRFTPEKGLDYSVMAKAGPKAEPGEVYPLRVETRRLDQEKSGR